MGYVIQPVVSSIPNIQLGISSTFGAPGVFTPLTTTTEQGLNNLKNLLLTRIGERYNMPTFGCNLSSIIFQPITEFIKQDIIDSITSAVSNWLPYINIESIDIKTVIDDPTLEYYIYVSLTISINGIQTQPIIIFATESGQMIVQ